MVRASAVVLAILLSLTGGPTVEAGRRVVTDSKIEILDNIRFVGTTAEIAATSSRMLDAVAETLENNPSIKLLEVRGFGVDAKHDQLVLGHLRARAVVAALVQRGVSPKRLRASGAARPDHGSDPAPEFLILIRR